MKIWGIFTPQIFWFINILDDFTKHFSLCYKSKGYAVKDHIEERAINIADYIIENKATVR